MEKKKLLAATLVATALMISSAEARLVNQTEITGTEKLSGNTVSDGYSGAAIWNNQTSAAIHDAVISNNTTKNPDAAKSGIWGGAIFNYDGDVEISGTNEFANNSLEGGYGGAFWQYGADKTLTIKDGITKFTNNSVTANGATGGYGGAIQIYNSNLDIKDDAKVTFDGNHSDLGGGALYLSYNSKATIGKNTEFNNNRTVLDSAYSNGGAIRMEHNFNGTLTLNGTKFNNNVSTDSAGAIYGYSGKLNIDGAAFNENKAASYGGAVANSYGSTIQAAINNATFENNTAELGGGAINSVGTYTISGSEFTGNSVTNGTDFGGGAILNEGNMTIADSRFTNNTANNKGGAIHNLSSLTLNGTNNFSGNKAGSELNDIHNEGTLNINGTANFDGGVTGNGTINLGAASLIDMLDEEVQGTSKLQAGTIDVADGAKIAMDWGDTIDADNITGSSLKLDSLYVEASKLEDGATQEVFSNAVGTLDTSSTPAIFGEAYKYTVAQGAGGDANKLVLTQAGAGGLAAAVADDASGTTFSFSGDYTETATIDNAGIDGGNLIIKGEAGEANNITINTDNGITVNSGHKLTVENVSSMEMSNDSSVIVNKGTTAINNSNVAKIDNAKDLTFDFGSSSDGSTIKTAIINSTDSANAKTAVNVADNVNITWDTTGDGITQKEITFAGNGHLVLSGTGGVVGNVINEMTGDTLVVATAIDGAIDSTSDPEGNNHISIENGGSVTGLITNSGKLDIKADGYNIAAGIADVATPAGTTNIGDGENTVEVTLADNQSITQNKLNILEKGKLTFGSGTSITTSIIDVAGELVNKGTITGDIKVGKVVDNVITATGSVDNQGSITGNITNDWGSAFKNSIAAATITGNVTNAGTFENVGSITGTASNSVGNHGTFDNSGAIGINVKNQGIFNNKAGGNITSSFENAAPEGTSSIAQAVLTNEGTISGGITNRAGQKVENKNTISGAITNYGDVVNTSGTISGSIANGGLSTDPAADIVTDATLTNKANITGNIENRANIDNTEGTIENTVFANYETGSITTSADNLKSDYVLNVGNIKLTGGSLQQNIIKSIAGDTYGTVEIDAGTDGVVSLNGKNITNNHVKLTSGAFDVTSKADSEGNIDVSALKSVIANGGTLKVQDGEKTGTITIGDVDTTAGALKVAIDADLNKVLDADKKIVKADTLSLATGKTITGGNKILIDDVELVADSGKVSPMNIQVADSTISGYVDMGTNVTVGGTNVGQFLLTYVTNLGDSKGYLHAEHSDITNAIKSTIDKKAYSVADGTTLDSAVEMGGKELSLSGGSITGSGNDGITLAAGQTLGLNNTTVSGFGTAINNSDSTGKVEVKNVTFDDTNTTAIANKGSVEFSNTDGNQNNVNSAITGDGTTTVKNGTTNFNSSVEQTNLVIENDANAVIANVSNTTAAIKNDGTLELKSGNNNNAITTSGNATDVAKLIVSGNVTNEASVTQKAIEVASGSTLELAKDSATNADSVTVTNGTLKLTDNAALNDTDGTGSANVDLTNSSTLALNAATQDVALNISISNSDDSGYGITAESAVSYSVTIANAIADATSVTAKDSTNLTLTDTALNSTNAGITAGSNAVITLDNTQDDDTLTVSNAIASATGGTGYTVNIENTGSPAGKTVLENTITGAATINANSGTTEINGNSNIAGATIAVDDSAKLSIDGTTNGAVTLASDVEAKAGNTSPATVTTSGDVTIASTVKDANVTAADDSSLTVANGGTIKDTTVTTGDNNTVTLASGSELNGTTLNSGNDNTITIANGSTLTDAIINASTGSTVNLGSNVASSGTTNINAATASTVNTMDGSASAINTTVTFADNSQLKIDVNAVSTATDKFVNAQQAAGDGVILTDISLQDLSKVVHNKTNINLAESTNLQNLTLSDELKSKTFTEMTPIRKMTASFTDDGNLLIMPSSGHNNHKDFNPAVLATPVAAQLGGYLVQLQSYDEAFRNMDMYMLMTSKQRQALKFRNKVASLEADSIAFDPLMSQNDYNGAWFRPYASFEKVGLHNGPRVENNMYGSYFGGESSMKELGNGWDGMWGAYVGYNGAHQHYSNVSMYENGGTLGLVGMAYKDNFFVGGTINVGANAGEADTAFGSDDFSMLMAGAAVKTGYNWELADSKFIIQPSLVMAYSFVNTFDYTNSAGVRINSDPLNAIMIEPGLKFIGNFKNGWQPYIGVSVVANLMDRASMKANDISLPSMSVNPYAKYGIGVRKTWGERFNGFLQMFITSGGRDGIGFQGGFRWAIGQKAGTNNLKGSVPQMKNTTVSLKSMK